MDLANQIASRLSSRIGPTIHQLTLDLALSMIPVKALHTSPHALHDGGGKGSQPDWSVPPNVDDVLKPLRDRWIPAILEQGLHKVFLAHIEQAQSAPPFSEECIDQFREVPFRLASGGLVYPSRPTHSPRGVTSPQPQDS